MSGSGVFARSIMSSSSAICDVSIVGIGMSASDARKCSVDTEIRGASRRLILSRGPRGGEGG